jgi:hypothetical protein
MDKYRRENRGSVENRTILSAGAAASVPQQSVDSAKRPGSQRARLEVIGRISEGGAGEVLAAIDYDIGRKVAIKKNQTRCH